MNEIISKRTYNQKVYDLGRGKRNYKIHSGHIHYKENGEFKDIDLHLRKVTGGWIMDKHNYHAYIPDYADGLIDFYNVYEGTNHRIRTRPITNHVLGEENHKLKYVLYKDAFGKGIDLKTKIGRSGLRKEIIINQDPKDDVHFDFEIILDAQSKDIREGLKGGGEIDTSLIGADLTGKIFRFGDKKASYVRCAKVWDSKEKIEKVMLTLFKQGSKLYLRKTIPKEYFKNAVFPVYTDHPTDYYSSTKDGYVSYSNSDWQTAHDAVTGSGVSDTITDGNLPRAFKMTFPFTNCYFYRTFYYFDTSGIGTGNLVVSCDLKLYVSAVGGNGSSVAAQKGTQAATLTTADYDAFSGSAYGYIASASTNQYNTISFNATGCSEVVRDGETKICCREYDHDYSNSEPDAQNDCYVHSYFTEDTGSNGDNRDPYLDIVTTPMIGNQLIMVT